MGAADWRTENCAGDELSCTLVIFRVLVEGGVTAGAVSMRRIEWSAGFFAELKPRRDVEGYDRDSEDQSMQERSGAVSEEDGTEELTGDWIEPSQEVCKVFFLFFFDFFVR